MGQHGRLASDEDVAASSQETLRGAVVGAARWGLYTGVLGAAAYFYSPLYRGLTVQFKVFLQMSGMTAGAVIEADRRTRDFEMRNRRLRKLRRDQEVWSKYEQGYAEEVLGKSVTINNKTDE